MKMVCRAGGNGVSSMSRELTRAEQDDGLLPKPVNSVASLAQSAGPNTSGRHGPGRLAVMHGVQGRDYGNPTGASGPGPPPVRSSGSGLRRVPLHACPAGIAWHMGDPVEIAVMKDCHAGR